MNNFKLLSMSFTLVCDREIPKENNPYYISPGGYELVNGKRFDFFSSIGNVDPENRTKVEFDVLELDDEYSDVITEKDLKKPFTEFFIYTGEYDDPQIGIQEVKDVEFEVERDGESKIVHETKKQMKSINAYIKAEISSE